MSKKLKTLLKECKSDYTEIRYFKELLEFLDKLVIPKRTWEEKSTLTKKEKRECELSNKVCDLDIYHCGKNYKQFVLGRLDDTKCFNKCPNYEVLNISDWSIHKNDLFIKYITKQPRQNIDMKLKPCSIFPIRIFVNKLVIPNHDLVKYKKSEIPTTDLVDIKLKRSRKVGIKDIKTLIAHSTKIAPGSVTSREICMLSFLKFNFYATKNSQGDWEDFVLLTQKTKKEIKKYYGKDMPHLKKIN